MRNIRHDLEGQRFGRLLVISSAPHDKWNESMWLCRCDCGITKVIKALRLRQGKTKSCGCFQIEARYKHGMRPVGGGSPPEYAIWDSMKQRCHNPKHPSYHNYGGRGITVCNRWRTSFKDFYADLGSRTTPKHTIDRINNEGNYEPGNVRWATRHENNMNTRKQSRKVLREVI